jgi:hypothetical protein
MSRNFEDAKKHKSKYWKNKPVMKYDEKIYISKQILNDQETEKFKLDNLTKLPDGYEWKTIDINNNDMMLQVSDFLTENFKRGTESTYILKYDPQRLQWEMNNKGYFNTITHENKIIALIGVTTRLVQIQSDTVEMVEPMYMCCEKKFREKGIAKVLMDETIRISALNNKKVGVFCDNRIVYKPVCTLRQYSRPINYKKLRENEFVEICGIDDEIVHSKTKINLKPNKYYVVAEKTDENIQIVYNLYKKYMEAFGLHMVLTKQDIEHYMFNDKYVKTMLIMRKNEKNPDVVNFDPIDFVTYNFYDLINTNKNIAEPDTSEAKDLEIKDLEIKDLDLKEKPQTSNIVKVANLFMYSSNNVRTDLIFINLLKQVAYDKIHIIYIMDMMHNNETILSNVKEGDKDTDDEEQNATYDMNIVKTGKKLFINLFNWKCESFNQNMVSWLTF